MDALGAIAVAGSEKKTKCFLRASVGSELEMSFFSPSVLDLSCENSGSLIKTTLSE